MASSVKVDGQLIEQLRMTRACLSREAAARTIGISTPALYYIERGRNGRHRTRPETLGKIARVLNVEPESLVIPFTKTQP